MRITTVNLSNNNRIFLLSDFFDTQIANDLLNLFRRFDSDPDSWHSPDTFGHRSGRYVYKGSDPTFDQVFKLAGSQQMMDQMTSMSGKKVFFKGIELWTDLPGYTIIPHKDLDIYDHGCQIYITDTPNESLGTTFYEDPARVLLQLPYRHNFGYSMDKTSEILHGLSSSVPENFLRHSIYLRYKQL